MSKSLAIGNSEFSIEVQRVLLDEGSNQKKAGENLIFSPLSLSAILAMVKIGARQLTAQEIQKGLHFPVDDQKLIKGYSKVLSSLNKFNPGYTLTVASRMYVKSGYDVRQEYRDAITNFGSQIESLDFSKNGAAAKEINKWIEYTTNEKISNVVSPDALNEDTRLVLVNGIYFKGHWKYKFDPKRTTPAPFYLTKFLDDSITVDMMYRTAPFDFVLHEEADAWSLSLPYKGKRLTMLIHVPRDYGCGLEKLEQYLELMSMTEILSSMKKTDEGEICLPKFKIETSLTLVETLKELGIEKIFSHVESDLSGMSESSLGQNLFVNDLVQKAIIQVDEQGSMAAVATASSTMTCCLSANGTYIKVDKPFLFQIYDLKTNFILFSGCCRNPTES